MKALTICQPYAHLIAIGQKQIENRTWNTSYRGPLAIHAGKSRYWLKPEDWLEHPGMVLGAIVAVAQLVDCVHITRLPAAWKSVHAAGPWCWLLKYVKPVPPIYCKGSLGLWECAEAKA